MWVKGNTLRQIREGLGLTLEVASLKANMSIGHLSEVERNESGISYDMLYALAKVYNLELEVRLIRVEGDIETIHYL